MVGTKRVTLGLVVVIQPLSAGVLVPKALVVTSIGLTGSSPAYSASRMEIPSVGPLKLTVIVLFTAAAMLLA